MSVKHLSEKRLQQYLDDKLKGLNRIEQEHLDSCDECQSVLIDYGRIYNGLARQPKVELSPGFAARTMARIRQQISPVSKYGQATTWLMVLGAVSCLVPIYYLFDLKALLESAVSFSLGDTIANSSVGTTLGQLSARLGDNLPILIFAGLILVAVPLVDRLLVRQKTTRAYFISV
jgi:anti-sigma factor RsiW